MWIHSSIGMYPHSLRKQSFSLADTVDMIFIASTVLDRLNNFWVVLQPNSPKHNPCLKDVCIFFERLKWPTSNVKKARPLPHLTDHYKRYLEPRIDCSIKMEMRYYTIIDFNEVDIGIYLSEKVIIHRGR